MKRIKESGDLFFAVSDREWTIDGAAVHVSIIGFDSGIDIQKELDAKRVAVINSNLTSDADITKSRRLTANLGLSLMGDTKGGRFEIPERIALGMIDKSNPHGRPNSDVLVPWVNGSDLTGHRRFMWIIDFGVGMPKEEAMLYVEPFEFIKQHVLPVREKNKRPVYRDKWWIHVEPRPALRSSILHLDRFVCTTRVSKHRLFVWLQAPTLADSATFVFARSDDYFFGVLHSRVHEIWARAQGTQVRERESGFRYTPSTCFETFPFPEPTPIQSTRIGDAAKQLNELRENMINPRDGTRIEVLEFAGSVNGPWGRYVHDADNRGIGTVRYPRQIARDSHSPSLKSVTLTALYNKRDSWLDQAHKTLDEAVFAAYGWDPGMTDDEILAALLALNLERAGDSEPGPIADEVEEESDE